MPLTLIAGLGHWAMGSGERRVAGFAAGGLDPGIVIGSHLTARIPEKALRPILAITLLLVGSKLVL